MIIRSFCEADAEKVSALIIHTLQASNSKDYSAETISALEKKMQPSGVLERASWTHFYVAEEGGDIIGCGAIGPYWGSETESSLFNIFVLPEYQGKGVGRKIIETLEQDGFFLRAERVEVPASITGVGFYRKLGYEYKNGIDRPDEERLYRLEKNRKTLKQS
nr:GNAT family N-acetyltransferase [uncultured Ruminococcus sp.]